MGVWRGLEYPLGTSVSHTAVVRISQAKYDSSAEDAHAVAHSLACRPNTRVVIRARHRRSSCGITVTSIPFMMTDSCLPSAIYTYLYYLFAKVSCSFPSIKDGKLRRETTKLD